MTASPVAATGSRAGSPLTVEFGFKFQSTNGMKFVLDSNVYDLLVETSEMRAKVIHACETRDIELLMTHVQFDELMAMPDKEKRACILAMPFTPVPTYGAVLGTSRIGLSRYGEPEVIDTIRSVDKNHTNDALLAATAKFEGAVLVTNDDRLTSRAPEIGVETWRPSRLLDLLDELE